MWAASYSPKFGKNMSRIAKLPVQIPDSVTVAVASGIVTVSGPKGKLEMNLPVEVNISDKMVKVSGESNLAGMSRTMIANMVRGVTDGWTKSLELSGTGYRAATTGKQLNLALGFSHPVIMDAPEGISFEVKENKITVLGANRGLVGLVAAKIRKMRPADPYKAKGFKYEGEVIVKKAGKAAKAGATTTK